MRRPLGVTASAFGARRRPPILNGMRILLISTYELGHQPLHVASPAAALTTAGHDVSCLDTSVQPWDPGAARAADAVAFSVPMHTAMRLALRGAHAVREVNPHAPICLYGLYAPVSRDHTLGSVADRLIAGEYEEGLVEWANAIGKEETTDEPADLVHLGRTSFRVPRRDLLPPLERYARLSYDGDQRLVGYVEASHGCAHRCAHCPVPAVYGGRIRLVDRKVVQQDIDQLVAQGARHITFGDPDFLNGWRHSLDVVRAMHERHPDVTFDCTTKVEHIIERSSLWDELRRCGCLFVVCALETVNDRILERLDKGHTTSQAEAAIELLRSHGIEMRPSLLPFTPWTTLQDVLDILDFVVEHDLIDNIDPVHYGIRLLLPEGSLLLNHPALKPYLGPYDPEALTYTWRAAEPRSDALAERIAALVHDASHSGWTPARTFIAVRHATLEQMHRDDELTEVSFTSGSTEGRPRLTEPWFC